MKTAEQILRARKAKGLTQEALAEASNLSLSTIQRIEKGKVLPRLHTLKVLSDVLGIKLLTSQKAVELPAAGPFEKLLCLLISLLLVFIPPLSILFLAIVWYRKQGSVFFDFKLKKMLSLQLITLILLLLLIGLSPIATYLLTGQKMVGHLNLPLLFYTIFVLLNLAIPLALYQQEIHMALTPKGQMR